MHFNVVVVLILGTYFRLNPRFFVIFTEWLNFKVILREKMLLVAVSSLPSRALNKYALQNVCRKKFVKTKKESH